MRVLRTLTFWHLWAVCCVNATKDDRKGTMSTVLNLTGRWHSLEAQARAQNSSQLFLKTSFSFIQYKVHICVHTRSIILSTSWSLPRLFLFASNATYAASTTAHVINWGRKTRDPQLGDRKILCFLPLYYYNIPLNPADFCILQWDARSFTTYATSSPQICLWIWDNEISLCDPKFKIYEVKMKVFQSVGFQWWSITIVRSGLYTIGPF